MVSGYRIHTAHIHRSHCSQREGCSAAKKKKRVLCVSNTYCKHTTSTIESTRAERAPTQQRSGHTSYTQRHKQGCNSHGHGTMPHRPTSILIAHSHTSKCYVIPHTASGNFHRTDKDNGHGARCTTRSSLASYQLSLTFCVLSHSQSATAADWSKGKGRSAARAQLFDAGL